MSQLSFYASLDEVRSAAQECRACARSNDRSQVVFGDGDPHAPLMLVAEYPSQTDDYTGRPFTGPAGEFLDELLGEAGIDRSQVWITNLVRCYATVGDNPGAQIRPASVREQNACSLWLNLEITFVDPKVIVAIGAPAASALIHPNFKLSEQRGSWHKASDNRWRTATLQPAYLMRLERHDPDRVGPLREQIVHDLRAAAVWAGLVT